MSNGTEYRSVPPFIEPPEPARQQNGLSSIRLVLMLAGSVMLFLSMLGAGKLLWEILGETSKPETLGAKLLWLVILFVAGWAVSLVNIRVLHSLVHPLIIRGFIWLTLGGILAVYARIIFRLYNQDFYQIQYLRYSLVFVAGFVALVSLHLLIEDHDLRPCAIPIAAMAFVHILVAVVHYVFRNDINPAFAMGDAIWLFVMILMSLLIARHFGILSPFRKALDRIFSGNV